jgi:hypothetical protein
LADGKHLETLRFHAKHQYRTAASGIEIPITISLDGMRTIDLLAKVDTGATFCIFQREYAEMLGLDVESGIQTSITTATGQFQAFGHELKLSCLGYDFDIMAYFPAQLEFPRNVLGLTGWFDRLRVGIVHYDGTVFLSHYNE